VIEPRWPGRPHSVITVVKSAVGSAYISRLDEKESSNGYRAVMAKSLGTSGSCEYNITTAYMQKVSRTGS
jgi:hypothetical protein